MVANMLQTQQQQEWQRGMQMWQRGMQEKQFDVSQEYLRLAQQRAVQEQAERREKAMAQTQAGHEMAATGQNIRDWALQAGANPALAELMAEEYYTKREVPDELYDLLMPQKAKTQDLTAEMRNYFFNLQKHERDIGREQRRVFGPPLPSGMVRERAEDRAYNLKYGEGKQGRSEIEAAIEREYIKYVADATKDLTILPEEVMTLPQYRQQFKLGEEKPVAQYTQQQINAYNKCRADGGDVEECKMKAGLK